MRWVLFLLSLLLTIFVKAHPVSFWADDTNNVRKNIYEGDTSYFPKSYGDYKEVYVYFDSSLKHKAAYYKYGRFNCDIDSAWFRNGQVKRWRVTIQNCVTCATIREWYPNGQLKLQGDYSNDTCTWINYYPSGKLEEVSVNYHDTMDSEGVHGWHYHARYYENGQKKYEPINPNLRGSEPFVCYYESGNKQCVTTLYHYTNYIGSYIEWYDNGQIKEKGEYADLGRKYLGFPSTDKTGTWSYYNESGKLIKEEFYEEGKLVKTIEY